MTINANKIWIVAEHQNRKIQSTAFEMLAHGRLLAQKCQCQLNVMIFGGQIAQEDLQLMIDCGADRIVVIESPALECFLVEPYSACLQYVVKLFQPEVILAAATSQGRTLMPYAAMKIHAGLTADCTQLDIEPDSGLLLQTRPAIGGNIMATIKCPVCRPQMATVRPKSILQASPLPKRHGEIVRPTIVPELFHSNIRYRGFIPGEEKIALQSATRVVAIGKGIKKPDNIRIVREFADAIGAAVGATREVVDRGWLSYPHQIGLSGKTVTADLYIAIGISGAIQHLAGMQTAAKIVAINSDHEANIFNIADVGIIGNLFDIVPKLTDKAKKGELSW